MRIPVSAAIAWRYLRSRKSYGAVGTISTVSVCAMAVATAAIVCVLSVFNGFRDIISGRLDTLAPDVIVTPASGKVMTGADSLARRLESLDEVETATATLTDNALVIANGQEMPVKIKGVDPLPYSRVTAIRSLIPEGYGGYIDSAAGEAPATVSIGVASRLRTGEGERLLIFAPRREGRVNMANPAASFLMDSLDVAGVYRSDQQEYDEEGIIAPIDPVRNLLQYSTEASAIELRARGGVAPERLARIVSERLGEGFIVRDRLQQQATNFRMIAIEKWVSFLLLGFILLIAGFNCISSLSMLVIEKEGALATLNSLGMSKKRIGAIFAWESLYVSLAGGLAGIALGVALCLIQQHFGLIRIAGSPGSTLIDAYPVRLAGADLLLTLVPVITIGLLTAAVTARFARSRTA